MAALKAQQIATAGDDSTINQTIIIGGATLTLRRPQKRNPETEIEFFYPQNRTIDLVGRDIEKSDLWDWISSAPRVSARAVIGSAGSGKTRLAIDTLDRVTRDLPDWRAGFLSRKALERFVGQYDAADLRWKKHGLIVVDYAGASAAALSGWLEELVDVAEHEGPKLRLLLLERRIEGWYDSLTPSGYSQSDVNRLLAEPIRLPALESIDRRQVLASTFTACREHLGAAEATIPAEGANRLFDGRLADPAWSDPLFLMMAAVVSVVDQDTALPEALALSRPRLAKRFAERERDRLERLVDGNPKSPEHKATTKLLIHLASYATLCAGLSTEQAGNAAEAEAKLLRLAIPGGAGVIADTLRVAYADDKGQIGAIELDAIGEAFVLLTLQDLAGEPAAAEAFVLRAAHTAPHAVPRTLIRAFQNFAIIPPLGGESDLTAEQTERLDDQRLLLGLWKSLIAEGTSDDLPLLVAIAAELPEQTTLLRAERVEVLQALLGLVPEGADDRKPLRARLLNNYSVFLSEVGDREGALGAIRKAVALYRELAAARPEALRPDLAKSLNNLSAFLSDLGDREGALGASREAVALYRELAAARPEAFRPDLAKSLNNLSAFLSAVGDREGALGASREAVALYRELAAARPEAFRPDLAKSLNNLSAFLSAVGDREGALGAIREAVALYRELAASRPEAFRPDLAASLNNLANQLSEVGDREGALGAIREAVALYRELAASRPEAFRPDLAMSLNNLANRLSEVGDREGALRAIREAVALYRELAASRPEAFRPDLAGSLGAKSRILSTAEDFEGAREAVREGITLLMPIAMKLPRAFQKLLVMLAKDYIDYSQQVKLDPEPEIMAQLADFFEKLKALEEDHQQNEDPEKEQS